MGYILGCLRSSELIHSIQAHELEQMQITRQLRQLASFSSAIGDGTIDPNEIANIGVDLFEDALAFMDGSTYEAVTTAQDQTAYYEGIYMNTTQEQYYAAGLGQKAGLYTDANGNLNTDMVYQQFYEEALKEYAEKVVMPILKEKEEELQQKKDELTMLIETEQAEYDAIKDARSEQIRRTTIQLK